MFATDFPAHRVRLAEHAPVRRATLRRTCRPTRPSRSPPATCWTSSTCATRPLGRDGPGRRAHDAALRPEPVRRPLGGGVRRRRAARRDARLGRRALRRLAAAAARHLRDAGGRRSGHRAHRAGHAAGQSRQPPSDGHRVVHRDDRRAGARPRRCSAGASATRRSGWPGCGRRASRSWRTARGSCARSSTASRSRSARPARRACRTTGRCRSGSPPAGRARCAWPAASPTASSSASGTHAGEPRRPRRRHPRRRRRGRPRSGGGARGGDLPHRAHGRSGARAADGQVDGRRLLRVLADALRSARASLDRARPRDAQARAARSGPTSTTPPTSKPAAAPSTSCPPKPPTPSACAAAPATSSSSSLHVIRTSPCALDYVVLHPIPDPRFPVDPAQRLHGARRARNPAGRPQSTRPLAPVRQSRCRVAGAGGRGGLPWGAVDP